MHKSASFCDNYRTPLMVLGSCQLHRGMAGGQCGGLCTRLLSVLTKVCCAYQIINVDLAEEKIVNCESVV